MKRFLFVYLATYLLAGGIGFAFQPELTLKLFLSNGEYGDVMPRVAGVFMLVLGGLVGLFVLRSDYNYYAYSVYARSGIVGFLVFLYMKSTDPLFLVLLGIVLLGLVPSIWLFLREGSERGS